MMRQKQEVLREVLHMDLRAVVGSEEMALELVNLHIVVHMVV